MTAQSPYVYVLVIEGNPPAHFTWPNTARKFIRDTYTNSEGELHLPPPGYLSLKRYPANPRSAQAVIIAPLDIGQFLAG
jgi:hypothetical protein